MNKQFDEIERKLRITVICNAVLTIPMIALIWWLCFGNVPLSENQMWLRPYLAGYLGLLTLFSTFSTIFWGFRIYSLLSEARVLVKQRRHALPYLAQLIPTPFFGATICLLKKAGEDTKGSEQIVIAIASKTNSQGMLPLLLANTPVRDCPTLEVTAIMDDSGKNVRALQHDNVLLLVAKTYPAVVTKLLQMTDSKKRIEDHK